MWMRIVLPVFCLLTLWGCFSNVQKWNVLLNLNSDNYSWVVFKETSPLFLKQIDKKNFEQQYVLSGVKNIRENNITCSSYDKHFIYEYWTGGVNIYTTRPFDRPNDIFRLYRFKMPDEMILDYTTLSKFWSCRVENWELFKIKKDGSLLDDYPTKWETKSTYKNTIPDVLFEIAQGRYDTIWAYRFGKNFNTMLLQNKAQYFLLWEKEIKPHSQYREFCHTLYTSLISWDTQKQYYEKLLFWSESDANHYYLLEYSFPTDRSFNHCPPSVFIDI